MGSDCHNTGLELPNELQHHGEVHLEAVRRRPDRVDFKETFFNPRFKVYPDGLHVPHDLALGFL